MPSLDGHSLNEEIKKLREEVFTELVTMRESFRELYAYIAKQEATVEKKTKKAKKPEKASIPQA
tara:strand:- start:1293 stop:1484 length:192 start_codon:yes stop_codon:yes gene_type:complete